MAKLQVKDLMTEEVVSVKSRDALSVVYELMESRHIRHIPVVDDDDNLEGLISHRDLLRSVVSDFSELPISAQREVLDNVKVHEIMTRAPESAEPSLDVAEAASLMLENKWSSLPVVENERLVGILTESDFVKFVAEEYKTS